MQSTDSLGADSWEAQWHAMQLSEYVTVEERRLLHAVLAILFRNLLALHLVTPHAFY